MQKFVKLVDLVKNFKTSAYLQKSASIQPRPSPTNIGLRTFFVILSKIDFDWIPFLASSLSRLASWAGYRMIANKDGTLTFVGSDDVEEFLVCAWETGGRQDKG